MRRWRSPVLGMLGVALAASLGVATYRAYAPGAPAVAPSHRACPRGEETRIAFQLISDGKVHPVALGGSSAASAERIPYRTEIEGELVLTCTGDPDAAGATPSTLELRDVRIASRLPPALLTAAPTKSGLESGPSALTLGARGRFDGLRVPIAMGLTERNVLRTVLSFASFVLPETPVASWSTIEAAPNTLLAMGYRVTGTGARIDALPPAVPAPKLLLDIERSERTDGLKTKTSGASLTDGRCRIQADAATGAPVAWSCERHDEGRLGALVAQAQTTTFVAHRVGLRRLDADEVSALAARVGAGRETTPLELSAAAELAAASRARDEALAAGASVPDVVARLRSGADKERDGRVLEALVRVRPEAREQLASELRDAGSSDKAFGTVARVLAEEGGEAGQRAVAEAASRAGDDTKKMHVLTAHLGLASEPTHGTESYLRAARAGGGEGARTADLALGNVAHTLLESEPARAKAILAELVEALARATTPSDQVHALRALGNVGSPDLVDVVAPYLQSTNEDVRQIAAGALRHVATERAVEILVNTATFDTSPVVRAAAVNALPSDPPSEDFTETLAHLLVRERSAVVLREIVLKLRAVVPSDGRAREVLVGYERTCANGDVCSLVKQVLLST